MKKIIKTLQMNYNFVNKINKLPKSEWVSKPLFTTSIFDEVNKRDFSKVTSQPLQAQLDVINSNSGVFDKYQNFGAYAIYATLSGFKFNYVIAGNFIENLNILELHIMDVDGFHTQFVELENLVPITYNDLLQSFILNVPLIDFIEQELIYKDGENYFVFDQNGDWNSETANLEALDFRNLFNEDKWVDQNLDDD